MRAAGILDDINLDWDDNYAMLVKYIEIYNGLPSSKSLDEEIARLGTWCVYQRTRNRQGVLAADKIERLQTVGFWETTSLDTKWFEICDTVKEYIVKTHHLPVLPYIKGKVNFKTQSQLGNWCRAQVRAQKSGKLSPRKQQLLDEMKFWDHVSDILVSSNEWREKQKNIRWNEKLEEVKAFKKREKRLPSQCAEGDEKKLGIWIHHQRTAYKAEKLNEAQVKKLIAIGIIKTLPKAEQ